MNKIIQTADGSKSLISEKFGDSYHSLKGALQESRYVFIDKGLKKITERKSQLSIFEMGFGTGLNALLTIAQAQNLGLKVHYTSIEAYPVEKQLIEKIGYPQLIDPQNEQMKRWFEALHQSPWNKEVEITENFQFQKFKTKLEDFHPDKNFDLVYYDAFAPNYQPELWTEEVFQKIYKMMNEGGILVTYCAKGSVKRALRSLGFDVESLPGPPGKREMTRALK